MPERRTGILAGLVALALVCGLAVQLRAQETAPKVQWEYQLLDWKSEDTVQALRYATGDQLATVTDMATELATEVEPINHPKLQAGVNKRLHERLAEAGAEGWELEWVRESTSIESGFVLPAPSAFLKRQKS